MALSDLLPHGYVDAHHHVWAPESLGDQIGYGWLRDIGAPKPFGDPTPIQRDYRIEEFLDEASMAPRASVHVQTDGALPDPVAETAFVQAEADRAGLPVAIVGLADLAAPDLAALLDRHAAYRGFRGVRQIVSRLEDRPDLSFAPRDYLADKQWVAGLKVLEDRGLSFDLQLYPEQAAAARAALSDTPALTVVIDHAISPYDHSPEGHARWSAAVRLLAARPNTYVKLSGWGMFQADWAERGNETIGPLVDELMQAFGAERVMWGSNYPVEKLATEYEPCLRSTALHLPVVERQNVFLRSAIKAYRLKLT